MKLNAFKTGMPGLRLPKKIFLYMKLTALIMTVALLQCSARGFSQKINLNETNAPLSKVLQLINKQTGYVFFYESKVVRHKNITVQIKDATVEEALNECLKTLPLEYKIVKNTVILKESEKYAITNIAVDKAPELVVASIPITGQVVDEKNLPLPGVTVKLKGGKAIAITDNAGKFKIDVPTNNSVLVFSFVGYKTKEVVVSPAGEMTINLAPDQSNLNDVVVIGYGTKKKVDLTGSVSTVEGSAMVKRPVTDPATMLEGLLPGVSVVQQNGLPGQGNTSIQVRGLGTFSGAGANPLILVDGVPGNIEDLNPNTIESVSVLKDAASASIYGSRGANGVILVTTKNGANSNGAIKVEYDFNYGIHSPTKLLDLVTNSPDYMRGFNENVTNGNYGVPIPSEEYTAAEIAEYTNPANTTLYPSFDWQHYMIKSAPTSMHNLSISGGGQTHYNLSLGYVDEEGTMAVYNYKKYNGQLNIVSDISKHWKIGTNIGLKNGITGSYSYDGQPSGLGDIKETNYYVTIISQSPTEMPTLPGNPGLYSWRAFPFEGNNWNPVEQAAVNAATTNDYSLTSQIWSDLEITKGLHWYIKGAANYGTSQFKEFEPYQVTLHLYSDPTVLGYQSGPPSLNEYNTQDVYTNLYSYLTYEKSIGSHHFNLMGGYSQEEDNNNYISGYRTNYATSTTPELNAGPTNGETNAGTSTAWAMESLFGRLSYDFKSKYLLETNLRYDGTSRLSPGTRWGAFPSVSAGWRITQEPFMESSKSWLSDLKLRASWGELGNQNIGLYPYQALIGITGAYPFNNSSLSSGAAQTALNNPNITWERTTSSDLGLDVNLFGKLSLTLDVFKKLTTDILRPAQVTSVVGLTAPIVNDGAMQNTGFDLDVQYNDQVKSGFLDGLNFSAGFNLSAFHNKLVSFGAPQDNGNTIDQEGLPWNSFYLLKVIGIFQNAAQIAAAPKQFGENTQPGMLQYADINHDGKIDNSDRVPITDGVFPAFTYGFHFSASLKRFDLYGFFQGVAGSKTFVNGWGVQPYIQGSAPTKVVFANAWTPQNQSNTTVEIGDPTDFNHPSTYDLFDNSYLRLKTIQIGYTLPAELTKKLAMSKVRLYIAGDNLLTITKYPFLDPEGAGSVNFFGYSPGITYPQNKVVSFGCNVTF